MDIVINEHKKAEEILKSKKIYRNLWKTKELLIKYFYADTMDKGKVRKSLMEFLKNIKHNTDGREYSIVKDMESIESAINIYTKPHHILSKVDSILISNKELEAISTLETIQQQRLAFILLVVCKLDNVKKNEPTKWINCRTKDYYKHTQNRRGIDYQEKMIGSIHDKGLIGFAHYSCVDNTSIRLDFLDKDVKKEDVAIEISDFRDVVLRYIKWKDDTKIGRVIECESCSKPVLTKSNRTKLCKECQSAERRRVKLANWHKNKAKYQN